MGYEFGDGWGEGEECLSSLGVLMVGYFFEFKWFIQDLEDPAV